MLSFVIFLAAAAAPAAAAMPERVSTLVVYGDDPCPKGTDPNEIVVCARQPEGERYRVPKRFRGQTKPLASQESWANTATELDWIGRTGTPNTCSPVGSGGQTGCFQQFLRQAREERRQAASEAADIP